MARNSSAQPTARPSMKLPPRASDGLPVIDLSADPDRVGGEIRDACAGIGMFHAWQHGVDTDALLRANAAFHALPLAAKTALQTTTFHRGYTGTPPLPDPPLMRDGKPVYPDQSEAFMIMSEATSSTGPLQGKNVWPDLAGFREEIGRCEAALLQLCRRVLRATAIGLGAPANFFDA